MARTAQILPFPRPAPSRADDGREIGLAIAISVLHRHDRSFDAFFAEFPGAVRVGDATVDRDALARFLGLGGRVA